MPLSNTGRTPANTGAVTRSCSRPCSAQSFPPRAPAQAGTDKPSLGIRENPQAGASGSGVNPTLPQSELPQPENPPSGVLASLRPDVAEPMPAVAQPIPDVAAPAGDFF